MQEFGKIFCVVVFAVTAICATLFWADDQPTPTIWALRVSLTLTSLGSIAAFLYLHFRRDLAPDFLHKIASGYFNRGGFCFVVFAREVDGVAYLVLAFQNQRDKPCTSKVALRPAAGHWPYNETLTSFYFDVECGPAGYGYSCLPIPLPLDLQGKIQRYEVGASVVYPSGKGRRIRFRDGCAVGANAEFKNSFGTIAIIGSAILGGVHLALALLTPRELTIDIQLPTFVAEELDESCLPYTTIFWSLGDPLPQSQNLTDTLDEHS